MVRAELDELKTSWPGWNLWRTENLWVATRRGPRPDYVEEASGPSGDLALTLIENGPHELRAALEGQAELEAGITASCHVEKHPVSLTCPLSCLGLKHDTQNALISFWFPGGQYTPTVGDLLNVRETGSLDDVPNLGRTRAAEIEARLEALSDEVKR